MTYGLFELNKMNKKFLKVIIIIEAALLLAWLIIENVLNFYTVISTFSFAAAVIILISFLNKGNRLKWKGLLLVFFINIILLSFFFMEISDLVTISSTNSKLAINYEKLLGLGFGLLPISILVTITYSLLLIALKFFVKKR